MNIIYIKELNTNIVNMGFGVSPNMGFGVSPGKIIFFL
jgi:hypothetical protein